MLLVLFLNLVILILFGLLLVNSFSQWLALTKATKGSWAYPVMRSKLKPALSVLIGSDLMLKSNQQIMQLPIKSISNKSPYQTLGELVVWLKQQQQPHNMQTVSDYSLAIYQLQYSGELRFKHIESTLFQLAADYESSHGDKHKIRFANQGERIDRDWMSPVNRGQIVVQPLGIAITNNEQKVISKAPVLCQ